MEALVMADSNSAQFARRYFSLPIRPLQAHEKPDLVAVLEALQRAARLWGYSQDSWARALEHPMRLSLSGCRQRRQRPANRL
jgi:hypothetical protein